MRSGFVLALALAAPSRPPAQTPLAAQTLRPFTASRPLTGETAVELRLALDQGSYRIGPADPELLYAMDLEYDPDRLSPRTRYRPDAIDLALASEPRWRFRPVPRARGFQGGDVALSREVEWDLSLALGRAETIAELGDLRLTALDIEAGAGRTALRFSAANRSLCHRASLVVEAGGELTLESFGNSGCREVSVSATFGRVTLDFYGALPGDVQATVDLTVGGLVLRVPRGAGVRVETERFLSLLDADGLIREGDTRVTPGYRDARRKIDVRVKARLARIAVEWVD